MLACLKYLEEGEKRVDEKSRTKSEIGQTADLCGGKLVVRRKERQVRLKERRRSIFTLSLLNSLSKRLSSPLFTAARRKMNNFRREVRNNKAKY